MTIGTERGSATKRVERAHAVPVGEWKACGG